MRHRDIIELGGRKTDRKRMRSGRDYVVGIDTGGTFTDGALLDYHSREIIASCKTLTTRDDLSTGIIDALKSLEIDDPARIRLVGISSTLATNSIAENRARNVALLLIGYDRDLIESYALSSKFPTRNIVYFEGGHTSQGDEKAPLDAEAIRRWAESNKGDVDALAISSYFSPLNPAHEKAAFAEIRKVCDLPVVLGHQLSTKIDSIRRATTACLNASLVAIMQEFIDAVGVALKDRGISAPLMIVKGDGSLMPRTQAVQKPVETVLSGPAASAIGGRFLSDANNAVVVDMGGTTTDIALIENGRMDISENGARVGSVETAVNAARIRTACIGCDSRISLGKGDITQIGPDRVVPLSRLADRFPSVKADIRATQRKRPLEWRPTDLEYWFLYREDRHGGDALEDEGSGRILRLLEDGPLSVTRILEEMRVHHAVQLNADGLIEKGVIERSTLTPTDLLHAAGHIHLWDNDTARIAVQRACEMHQRCPDTFAEKTLAQIVHQMTEELLIFLARQRGGSNLPEMLDDGWGRWFFHEMTRYENPFVAVTASCRFPIIGIGGPADYFVRRVARCLNAEFTLPPSAAVANAVGAVAGSVTVDREALIFLKDTEDGQRFLVQIDGLAPVLMEEEDDAAAHAERILKELAYEEALRSGAAAPTVLTESRIDGSVRRVLVRAVGNPELSALKHQNNTVQINRKGNKS